MCSNIIIYILCIKVFERELSKYRGLSEKLNKISAEKEKLHQKLQTDKLLWEKKRRDEEIAWEKKKDEDLKKIKRERLLLEQQRKSNALLPEKKERQEISLLKEQIHLLQESNKAKNIKLQFEIDRLKTKCDLYKKEKEQLSSTIEHLEKEKNDLAELQGTSNPPIIVSRNRISFNICNSCNVCRDRLGKGKLYPSQFKHVQLMGDLESLSLTQSPFTCLPTPLA